jgi:glutathione synthase/RimK-type ligase-like ATP-grasp enzyme
MQNETRRAWGGAFAAYPSIHWVNHPLKISAANYKPEQIARAKRSGLLVPDTLITTLVEEADAFCERHNWSVVTKPIGHGEILGAHEADDHIVYTNLLSSGDRPHLRDVAACPTFFQQAISKDIDVRATVVDREVIAVALHSQERAVSRIDCRRDNMSGMRYSSLVLPAELCAALIEFVRSYGLYYAAIDLARDPDGRYWFLELNPAGQWAWLEQLVGVPISSALIRCLSQ